MPRKRQVLAKRTQAERKAERKTLGKLRHQVVAEKTEERYFTQVSRFLSFLNSNGKPYPRSFLLLDQEVCNFIEELWEQGDPQGWASDCLSGLGHFIPACKPHLIGAWRLHSAWSRAELPCRAPPFTPLIVYALAQQAVANYWTDVAVLLLLGFHTYARAGELFQAKVGDFVFDQNSGTWTLPLAKADNDRGRLSLCCSLIALSLLCFGTSANKSCQGIVFPLLVQVCFENACLLSSSNLTFQLHIVGTQYDEEVPLMPIEPAITFRPSAYGADGMP